MGEVFREEPSEEEEDFRLEGTWDPWLHFPFTGGGEGIWLPVCTAVPRRSATLTVWQVVEEEGMWLFSGST